MQPVLGCRLRLGPAVDDALLLGCCVSQHSTALCHGCACLQDHFAADPLSREAGQLLRHRLLQVHTLDALAAATAARHYPFAAPTALLLRAAVPPDPKLSCRMPLPCLCAAWRGQGGALHG